MSWDRLTHDRKINVRIIPGQPYYHLLSIPGYSRRNRYKVSCNLPGAVTQHTSAKSLDLLCPITPSLIVSLENIQTMTTYSLQALRDAREQRLARICVPTQVPIDALACWNGQRFVSWNEWLLSLGFTDHTKHDTTQIELASVD